MVGHTMVLVYKGQSNMVGLGQPYPSPADPRVAWEGLDFRRGVPEAASEYVASALNLAYVVAVQCSVGGTSIYQWQPGQTLDTQCNNIVSTVLKKYPGSKVAGVFFWQGEYDAHENNVPWTSLFETMVAHDRVVWGTTLPYVFCQIDTDQFFGQAALYPQWDYIKAQQAAVPTTIATMVTTDDITDIADSVHVGPSGLTTIGQRMAGTFLRLI